MENENCTFVAQPIQRKRKRYAIRDFPEGCGSFGKRVDPNTFRQLNDTILELGLQDLEDEELISAAEVVVACDSSNVSKFSSFSEGVLCDGSEFSSSDGNNIDGSDAGLKEKAETKEPPRRELIRDFPPLCGPHAYADHVCRLQGIEDDDTDAEELGNDVQDESMCLKQEPWRNEKLQNSKKRITILTDYSQPTKDL